MEHTAKRTPVRREITEDIQNALDKYLVENDVKILEEEMEDRVAHVVDVIFKESVRTYEELEFDEEGTIGGPFLTPYELFDKDKVFFGKRTIEVEDGVEEDWTWSYPITIWKRGAEHFLKTNWKTHNYVYREEDEFGLSPFDHLDEDGNLYGYFYQDIDIFGSEDTWKEDLIKSLYMVVGATYDWWIDLKKENEKIEKFMKENGLFFHENEISDDDEDEDFDVEDLEQLEKEIIEDIMNKKDN